MALESSFVPFPSEVVLPPAGYLAAQGRMSVWLAVSAGLFGSLLGAMVNYFLAAKLGRPLLYRYGRYVLMKEKSLKRAEEFFQRHGAISMFVGRLIPVIRQLISLPAGFARMRLDLFVLYTALGAGIWCAVLTYVGWLVGKNTGAITSFDELLANPELRAYTSRAVIYVAPLIALVIATYVIVQVRRRRSTGTPSDKAEIDSSNE
jgi:membrane protein DedA with SNARE-associated domain